MGPLSYVCGYRGGIGRRGVGQDTTRDDVIKIRARDGRYELVLWRRASENVRMLAQPCVCNVVPCIPLFLLRQNAKQVSEVPMYNTTGAATHLPC